MKNKSTIIFFLSIFCFFFVFYYQCHPTAITTADDWIYLSKTRDAIPIQSEHNPIKVLPEILMPFAANIFSSIIMPFNNDFIESITIGSAFFISIFVVIYIFSFFYFLKNKLQLDTVSNIVVTSFFILFHFLIFRYKTDWNAWLFGSYDLTCYYNYTIPILLNFSLVLFLITNNWHNQPDEYLKKLTPWKKSLFYLIIYLCIFCNLYASIIIASYISISLLYTIFFNTRLSSKSFIKKHLFSLCIIGCFLLSLWMESHGHNANQMTANQTSYYSNLLLCLSYYLSIPSTINSWFVVFSLFIFICIAFLLFKNKYNKTNIIKNTVIILSCCIICNIFSILISSKAEPNYVVWQDRMLMEFAWFLILISFFLGFCIQKISILKEILPLLFVFLLCHTNTSEHTFRDVEDYSKNIRLDYQIIDIMKEADNKRIDSVTLYVPNIEDAPNNWPLALYMSKYLSNVLVKHGIILRPKHVTMIPVRGQKDITTWILPSNQDSIVKTFNNCKIE